MTAIERFDAATGARIYRLPVEAFPGFIVYCYVLLEQGVPTLIDCGSGIGNSGDQLVAGIAALRTEFGEALDISDIRRVLITHGHIDHFGGLGGVLDLTTAQVGVHPLDRRVLTNYEERVIIATKDLRVYLERAGIPAERRTKLMEMYGFGKKFFRSVNVDFALDEGIELDGMRFIHTPGHCPGQVCIVIGDVLISADHVLAVTTPHQAPESITAYTGLGHYFEALAKVARLDGIRVALGGHETPIYNLHERIGEIRASHERKLERVETIMRDMGQPCTIGAISRGMYPERHGYDVLLALEEVGAHVEYLYQHGRLMVANLDEVEREDNPALQYALA
ncbi:MAG: MBL fold metallo-hydrolase [Chloroflexi bacterium]|uniref:MBL fold metallo-hydrolase n=1 Tax=Candidatus Flexifilum breve TaxID=3140694 RepID=UPI003135A4D8|nr:MBL fold metallo-hydrolase [Chloroflexota bacterium]